MNQPPDAQQVILFVAASPDGLPRLEQELHAIKVELGPLLEQYCLALVPCLSVHPLSIQKALLDKSPKIVHFVGRQMGTEGLFFEGDAGNPRLVDEGALASLFELFMHQIKCVLLNGCYSETQALAIAQHIPYVIGMKQAAGDNAAIAFAASFYNALGSGRDIEFAYKLSCAAIQLEGIPDHLMPVLLKQSTTGELVL